MTYPTDQSLALPATALGAPVYELSSWVRRVGASMVDGVVVCAVVMPLSIVIQLALGHNMFAYDPSESLLEDLFNPLEIAVNFVVTALMTLLYPSLLMAKTDGRTLGKRATNIRVVRESGEPISYGFALKRELLVKSWLFGFIGLYLAIPILLNYLWPLWDKQNRALHDMIMHTRVVRDYPAVNPAPYVPGAPPQL